MEELLKPVQEALEQSDAAREALIKESRVILKNAKQAITALHRDDVQTAKVCLDVAGKEKNRLLAAYDRKLTGAFGQAIEEFAEATLFAHYLEHKKLIPLAELNVTPEEYVGALADLTGELGRRVVLKATVRDTAAVQEMAVFCTQIFDALAQISFRNGELRRKFDAVKYNVQKIEKIQYDLSLVK